MVTEQTKDRLTNAVLNGESCRAVESELREVMGECNLNQRGRIVDAVSGQYKVLSIARTLRVVLDLPIYQCAACGDWIHTNEVRPIEVGDVCVFCEAAICSAARRGPVPYCQDQEQQ